MSRGRTLPLMIVLYCALASSTSLLAVRPTFYGLSTILGTTILGTTVLGTTVLGTTVLGTTSLIQVYADALLTGQFVISLAAMGMLVYLELSDPSFARTWRLAEELRKSWLPLSVFLVLLFALIVAFKVWIILS